MLSGNPERINYEVEVPENGENLTEVVRSQIYTEISRKLNIVSFLEALIDQIRKMRYVFFLTLF